MARPSRKTQKRRRIFDHGPLLVIILGAGLLVSAAVGSLAAGYLILGLPDISSIRTYRPPMVTEIYDSELRPLAYWYEEKRWPVGRSRIPSSLVQAFLAAEDARFYEHPGIDFMGVLRAVLRNVEAGGIVQGASTITQQVTRSLLLSPERSWLRKVKEAILAWQIDAALSKDQILTLYLNQIYLGQGAYGVEAAARTYFGKHVEELNLAEGAMLAGLPKAPSRYNPVQHMDLARKRQEYVLRRMTEEGFITEAQAEEARQTPIQLASEELRTPPGVEYFLAEVRRELESRYGRRRLLTEGLKVVTTLRWEWQEKAVQAVTQGLKALAGRHPGDKELAQSVQAALIAMENGTGAVRALVGGKDFQTSQFNLATQGRRPPGSAFKPIVYTAALANGIVSPTTMLVDEPVSLPGAEPEVPWEPENFDRTYMGPITVRTALMYSRNVISVKLAKMVGLTPIRSMAHRMGIETPLANDLSLALGSSGVSLMQMVRAYSTFPNLGQAVRPQFIQAIRDRDGRVIESMTPEFEQIVDPITAYQMIQLMEDVVQNGTGRTAQALGIPVGGKTGTTDSYRDAWFLGFTSEVVAGVWVGREDLQPLGSRETGGRVACPVWTTFMSITNRDKDPEDFSMPNGTALVPVNRQTGDIIVPEKQLTGTVVWEAMREDSLPPLQPSSGRFGMPSWLHRLDDFFFTRQTSSPFEEPY